jgi:hypothetical protein
MVLRQQAIEVDRAQLDLITLRSPQPRLSLAATGLRRHLLGQALEKSVLTRHHGTTPLNHLSHKESSKSGARNTIRRAREMIHGLTGGRGL